jgi:hypothetical protein
MHTDSLSNVYLLKKYTSTYLRAYKILLKKPDSVPALQILENAVWLESKILKRMRAKK